jgi:creatinine amidohydrolase
MSGTRRGFVAALAAVSVHPQSPSPQPLRIETILGAKLAEHTAKLAVLPLGSIEYHGPGAALGTDALLGAGLAARICGQLAAETVLFPAISFTHSPTHTRAFPGTISVRPEVMTEYIAETLRGIVGLGFRRVFVLNAHDGNVGPARGAVSQVTHEPPQPKILYVNWWESMPGDLVDSLKLFTQPNGGHGHGGPFELSAAAGIDPAALAADRGPDRPAPPELSLGFPYYSEKTPGPLWPGYSGKVSEASAAKGEKIITLAVERITSLVRRWLANPDAPGAW